MEGPVLPSAEATGKPVDRISLADDRELRLIRGLWFEVQLVPLPAPNYRPCREVQRRPLKPYDRRSRIVDVEVTVRTLPRFRRATW